MTKLGDTRYTYQPPGYSRQVQYGLRLYAHRGRQYVILTELPDNPGLSITNAAEPRVPRRWFAVATRNAPFEEGHTPHQSPRYASQSLFRETIQPGSASILRMVI